jgi:hypothetical protein
VLPNRLLCCATGCARPSTDLDRQTTSVGVIPPRRRSGYQVINEEALGHAAGNQLQQAIANGRSRMIRSAPATRSPASARV